MTKGDKIKLRAELAGKAMEGVIAAHLESAVKAAKQTGVIVEVAVARIAKSYADALMAELGISLDKED